MAKKPSQKPDKPALKPTFEHRIILARRLDQLADHNLHLGFHYAAELLSRKAADLREGGR